MLSRLSFQILDMGFARISWRVTKIGTNMVGAIADRVFNFLSWIVKARQNINSLCGATYVKNTHTAVIIVFSIIFRKVFEKTIAY